MWLEDSISYGTIMAIGHLQICLRRGWTTTKFSNADIPLPGFLQEGGETICHEQLVGVIFVGASSDRLAGLKEWNRTKSYTEAQIAFTIKSQT